MPYFRQLQPQDFGLDSITMLRGLYLGYKQNCVFAQGFKQL